MIRHLLSRMRWVVFGGEAWAEHHLPLKPDAGRRHVGTLGVVLLVPDAELRTYLRGFLDEDGVGITGETGDPTVCLDLAVRTRPNLVLMHLPYTAMDSLSIIRRLRSVDAPVPVMALVPRRPWGMAPDALRAGAFGFVFEESSMALLLEGVRAVALGRLWIDPAMHSGAAESLQGQPVG
jgi:DNA-binding NarL/FixJ family response regulator